MWLTSALSLVRVGPCQSVLAVLQGPDMSGPLLRRGPGRLSARTAAAIDPRAAHVPPVRIPGAAPRARGSVPLRVTGRRRCPWCTCGEAVPVHQPVCSRPIDGWPHKRCAECGCGTREIAVGARCCVPSGWSTGSSTHDRCSSAEGCSRCTLEPVPGLCRCEPPPRRSLSARRVDRAQSELC